MEQSGELGKYHPECSLIRSFSFTTMDEFMTHWPSGLSRSSMTLVDLGVFACEKTTGRDYDLVSQLISLLVHVP